MLPLPPGEGGGEGTGPLIRLHALHGPGAGNSPRRATHFSCLAKKSKQKKATPLSATLRFATGNLRCSRSRPAAELAAFTSFTALKQLRQVRPRSACLRTRGRLHCAPRRSQRGGGTSRAIAALGPRRPAARGLGPQRLNARSGDADQPLTLAPTQHKDAPWRVGVQPPLRVPRSAGAPAGTPAEGQACFVD